MKENEIIKDTTIEEQYKSLSEIDRVLHRSGMYIGSKVNSIKSALLYKPSTNEILNFDFVETNAGILKLVDEVLTNSVDEFRSDTPLFRVTKINVTVNVDGTVIIEDNGGIPVVIHKGENCYLPIMLFGKLGSGGNYNIEENTKKKRKGAGLNGLGSKLTNIYSEYFEVTTSDAKNEFNVSWSNNMKSISEHIVKPSKKHGTRIKFKLELKRFGVQKLSLDIIRQLNKRVIDASASNLGLEITFKSDFKTDKGESGMFDKIWKFNNFEDFVRMHNNDLELQLHTQKLKNNQVLTLSKNIGFGAYGFVNGTTCSDGTHIKIIQKQIATHILKHLKEEHNITLLTAKDVENNCTLFCSVNVDNPDYDSQTKEKLSNELTVSQLKISEEFLNSLDDSQIIKSLIEYYEIKFLVEEKKNVKKLNKALKGAKSEKLISCASKDINKNELFLFEGTSAIGGFKTYRDVHHQSAYELRGKLTNVWGKTPDQAMLNKELREVIIASNLQFNNPKHNLQHCNFSKFIFGADADFDGNHITALGLCFFSVFFPELVNNGRMYRLLSPIIIAKNLRTKEETFFYDLPSYEKVKEKYENPKSYKLKYIKGMGGLLPHHYETVIQKRKLMHFKSDKQLMKHLSVWFGDSTDLRKVLMQEGLNMDIEE